MIDGRSVLAVIPARGGSKGVRGKNVRTVHGRPLIAWTIAAARRSRFIDRVIVSTNDDAISAAALEAGAEVPFRRPEHLATDTSSSIDVVVDALERTPGFDYLVLLQPTSPLRTTADIDAAIERCQRADVPACVSVTVVEEHPQWMFRIDEAGRLTPLLPKASVPQRRQDLPEIYRLNGAVYVARTAWLVQARTFLAADTVGYVMPGIRSLDIDTESDFQILEQFAGEFDNA